MRTGEEEDVPDAIRGEDLSTLRGRLRATMILKGRPPTHAAILAHLAPHGISKQNVSNWLKRERRFIEPERLFIVAKALGVCANWLANGVLPILEEERVPLEARAVIKAWLALPIEHRIAMLEAMKELRRQLEPARWPDGERRAPPAQS